MSNLTDERPSSFRRRNQFHVRYAEVMRLRRDLWERLVVLTFTEAERYHEIMRLRGLLERIRRCEDARCGLCSSCIGALQQVDRAPC